ncbi:hypothetical protein KIW84_030700 [Lathyrus oleraceus]|uniref:Uncharacterized protein n=1 Tax=Pisum sativum TaxID=3888 RepID=A0A9D5AZU4_PEA|nr:hypothetical protein KIW84_030700 [Pisum sativum]
MYEPSLDLSTIKIFLHEIANNSPVPRLACEIPRSPNATLRLNMFCKRDSQTLKNTPVLEGQTSRDRMDRYMEPFAFHVLMHDSYASMHTEQKKFCDIPHAITMTTNTSNNILRSILDKEKLSGTIFLDWHRNLRIVLKHDKKLYVLETPVSEEEPPSSAPKAERDAYKKHVDDANETACLI